MMGMITAKERAEDCLEMCRLVFGENRVNDSPVTTSLFNCTSPLVWDTTMLDAMRVFAEHNQAIILSPFPMTGASSPITVAGTLVQIVAEAMAGMAYVQLVRPGTFVKPSQRYRENTRIMLAIRRDLAK